jgi:hypothetical protein
MKRIITICATILLTASVLAQAPEKMSYQAVIRNSSNALVTGQTVGMRISILQGSAIGSSIYIETQVPTTNINGLASIEIGGGSVVSGNFSTIDWSNGPYFVKTETDPDGGTNYSITGTSQFLSVPYALHSKTAKKGSVIQSKQYPDGFEGVTAILPVTGTYTVPSGKYLVATETRPDYFGFSGNFGMAVAGQTIGSNISYIDENIVITILGGGFTIITGQLIDKDLVMPVFFDLTTTYTVPVNKTLVASLPWSFDASGSDYYLINGQTFYNPQIDVFSAGTTITYVANGTPVPLNNFLVSGYLK